MNRAENRGKMLTVKEGRVVCPICRRKMSPRILPTTCGTNMVSFCRSCKSEIIIDVEMGQCFESQGQ